MPWRLASRPAATSPAGPAPMTITSCESVRSGYSRGRRSCAALDLLARPSTERAQPDAEDGRDHDQEDLGLRQVRLALETGDRVGREDEGAEEDAAGEAADRALARADVLLAGHVSAGDAENRQDEVDGLRDAQEDPCDRAEHRRHDERDEQLGLRRV